jgi:hypothetical protein
LGSWGPTATTCDPVVRQCRKRHGVVIAGCDSGDQSGADATPVLVLTDAETQVVERFIRYWLNDASEGLLYQPKGVDVACDY